MIIVYKNTPYRCDFLNALSLVSVPYNNFGTLNVVEILLKETSRLRKDTIRTINATWYKASKSSTRLSIGEFLNFAINWASTYDKASWYSIYTNISAYGYYINELPKELVTDNICRDFKRYVESNVNIIKYE